MSDKCDWKMRMGWKCSRVYLHSGPCALRPKWWNLLGQWQMSGRANR